MTALRELNHDVWLPFIESFGTLDADAFAAIHHPDLVRISSSHRTIVDFDTDSAGTRAAFARATERGDRLAIDFRFTDRLVSGDLASERGIYRTSVIAPDGSERHVFARFHTVARRVDGRWLLIVDHDEEAADVDAAAFDRGRPVGDVEAFTA